MHLPIPEQGRWLASVLRGHCQLLRRARQQPGAVRLPLQVVRNWYMDAAASQPAHHGELGADACALADRWLPPPQILHPWPDARFDATTQGRSPVR